MLRAEKAELIEDMSSVFRSSGVVVLTHYKGMTVAEMGDLRGQMRKVGASSAGDQEPAGEAGA